MTGPLEIPCPDTFGAYNGKDARFRETMGIIEIEIATLQQLPCAPHARPRLEMPAERVPCRGLNYGFVSTDIDARSSFSRYINIHRRLVVIQREEGKVSGTSEQ